MSVEALDQRKAAEEFNRAERKATKALPQLWIDTVDLIRSGSLGKIQRSEEYGWHKETVKTKIPYKGNDIGVSLSFNSWLAEDLSNPWEQVIFKIYEKEAMRLSSYDIDNRADIKPYNHNKGPWQKADPKLVLDMVKLINFLRTQPKRKK